MPLVGKAFSTDSLGTKAWQFTINGAKERQSKALQNHLKVSQQAIASSAAVSDHYQRD
jgi:hypothetical protein